MSIKHAEQEMKDIQNQIKNYESDMHYSLERGLYADATFSFEKLKRCWDRLRAYQRLLELQKQDEE